MAENRKETAQKILDSALRNGVIADLPASQYAAKLGDDAVEASGYVLAWDRYVLVVADEPKDDGPTTQFH